MNAPCRALGFGVEGQGLDEETLRFIWFDFKVELVPLVPSFLFSLVEKKEFSGTTEPMRLRSRVRVRVRVPG